ncbi:MULTISPECIES: cupin domain-containing protein [Myxococcus]|uniref:cupin domain-containing protein n=1 Tax=Myxococcus TaxID=32 RepID=UPI0013D5D3D6|nr:MULTISPECIES: cupin domain-containing protein [Myxococcus]NVJ25558.1 cupin domain-containing protein [Myxococcus sp. AM011]
MASHLHLVHEPSLPWTEVTQGPRVSYRRKQLGAAAKGQKLGCSIMELAPGKHAFPLHFHLANEEAYFILSGTGRLRLADTTLPVKTGDYVALPVGPTGAHQLVNDGAETLRYLAFSTMVEPDVMVYPDSKKVCVTAGSAPGGDKAARTLYTVLPLSAEVDYWSGEER